MLQLKGKACDCKGEALWGDVDGKGEAVWGDVDGKGEALWGEVKQNCFSYRKFSSFNKTPLERL